MVPRILKFSLILILILAVATVWKQRQNATRAIADYPPEGALIDADGHVVHVVSAGSGPDVVLIHGASGNTRDYTFSLMGKLAQDFRVHVVDRPGFGYSDPIPGGGSIQQQASRIRDAIRQIGVHQPIVLGQSYGGAVALAWATDAPESLAALVTVSAPSHLWPEPPPGLYRTLSMPVVGPVVAYLISAWVPQSYVQDAIRDVFAPQDEPAGYGAHYGPGLFLRPGPLRTNAFQRLSLKDEIRSMMPKYATLSLPIESVHGTADQTVGIMLHAENLVLDAPNARLTALPGQGHMPHHTAEAAIIAAVQRAAERAGLHPTQ